MTYIPSAPRFHSPSAPLRAALASLPGYDSHTRAIEALKVPLAEANAAREAADSATAWLASGLTGALLGTTEDAAAVIEASTNEADKAEDKARTAAAAVKLIEAAERQLGIELDDIIRSGYDRILKHLNGTLKDAYTKSRKLGLRGIHDAEQAIEAGKADAWSTMLELRTTIFHTRTAQSTIVGRLGSHETIQRLNTFGTLENYADLDPTFLQRRTSARWGNEQLTAPWPTMGDGQPDPVGMHAWILDNPAAQPWVPTEAQLTAAIKEAELAARAAAHVEQDA
jgi:hypothetical protein